MQGSEAHGPLKGLRVLDMTSVVMGPLCTQLLGAMGAEVIKVESLEGDINRNLGPRRVTGMSGTFKYLNNNKKSIAIDLKSGAGMEILLKLCETADVLIHSIRPDALKRVGLDYSRVSARNREIVFCNLFGFGRGGEYFGRPAYDDTIQAVSGLAMLQAEMHDEPAYVTSVFADKVSGISAAYAILAAIIYRNGGGGGQEVDVPMFEVMAQCILAEHATGSVFAPPLSRPVYNRTVSRQRRPFKTSDGYLSVLVYSQRQFERFFALAGRDDVPSNPKFQSFEQRTIHSEEYYALLGDILRAKSTEEWLRLLGEAEIPCIRLNSTEDLYSDLHLKDVEFFVTREDPDGPVVLPRFPIRFAKSPALGPGSAPQLSEQASEVLAGSGYDEQEIEKFYAEDIVKRPPRISLAEAACDE